MACCQNSLVFPTTLAPACLIPPTILVGTLLTSPLASMLTCCPALWICSFIVEPVSLILATALLPISFACHPNPFPNSAVEWAASLITFPPAWMGFVLNCWAHSFIVLCRFFPKSTPLSIVCSAWFFTFSPKFTPFWMTVFVLSTTFEGASLIDWVNCFVFSVALVANCSVLFNKFWVEATSLSKKLASFLGISLPPLFWSAVGVGAAAGEGLEVPLAGGVAVCCFGSACPVTFAINPTKFFTVFSKKPILGGSQEGILSSWTVVGVWFSVI